MPSEVIGFLQLHAFAAFMFTRDYAMQITIPLLLLFAAFNNGLVLDASSLDRCPVHPFAWVQWTR